jgi:hypothetical protein
MVVRKEDHPHLRVDEVSMKTQTQVATSSLALNQYKGTEKDEKEESLVSA